MRIKNNVPFTSICVPRQCVHRFAVHRNRTRRSYSHTNNINRILSSDWRSKAVSALRAFNLPFKHSFVSLRLNFSHVTRIIHDSDLARLLSPPLPYPMDMGYMATTVYDSSGSFDRFVSDIVMKSSSLK